MRKSIDVNEALLSHSLMNRKIMNDIMYYLRRLIKLARRAQTLSLKEGVDINSDSLQDFLMEFSELKESIKDLESAMEEK